MRARLWPLLLVALLCGSEVAACEPAAHAAASSRLRVLFIGNSLTYANELPSMLERLLVQAGVEVGAIEAAAAPNLGLEDHWQNAATRRRIERGGWDVVILQQGPSATEGRPSLIAYSRRFGELIRAAGARPALYMVWPAASRSQDFDGVSDAYRTAAKESGALLFPVGEAWRAAWRRDPGLQLYGSDGFHPSLLGTYLAALVMFEQFANRDPRKLPAEIPSSSGAVTLSAEQARTLQEAAAEANASFAAASTAP